MRPANRPQGRNAHGAAPCGARRILIVCGNAMQADPLGAQLEAAGHRVRLASSASAALDLARADPPDVVLCDMGLPGAPAAEVLRGLRAMQAEGTFCYVVALVPRGREEAGTEALEAGADDLLAKPVSAAELTARLAVGARLVAMAEGLRAGNRQAGEALERLQRTQASMEADLAEARKLQQGLLGERTARFGPFSISLLLRPAGHVGGDMVGFFPINARRVALYAIDVSGAGVAAALLSARLAAHLSGTIGQNIALRIDEHDLYDAHPPAEVARLFNRMMLEELRTDTFFTMVYVDIDVVSGTVRLVQAGHPHPLRQRSDGSVEVIGDGGMPIGLLEGATYDEVEFSLAPGERLFIASDGITEAADPLGTLLDEEGLVAILRTNAFLRGTPLLESLCWSVAQFTRGERTDDISALLIERDME